MADFPQLLHASACADVHYNLFYHTTVMERFIHKQILQIYEIKFKHYNVKDTVTFSHNVLVV